MKTLIGITSISLCLATFPLFAQESSESINAINQETTSRVVQDPTKVLEVVAQMTAKAPSAVASIVQSAIKASKADEKLTAKIVEIAIRQLPDQWYVIVNAALAVAPDAATAINEVVARIVPNPLDIPGAPSQPPPAPNPPISIPTLTPAATEVDFSN
jgi:DNA-directed RNA polymerase subunit F